MVFIGHSQDWTVAPPIMRTKAGACNQPASFVAPCAQPSTGQARLCDDSATKALNPIYAAGRQPFGDVCRHNLTLNQSGLGIWGGWLMTVPGKSSVSSISPFTMVWADRDLPQHVREMHAVPGVRARLGGQTST